MTLESLSMNHLKIPIKKQGKDIGFENINRSDPSNYLTESLDITTHGRPSLAKDRIQNVMRHDYLRKSMVDRIERKSLLAKYQRSVAQESKERSLRLTRAHHLRSQSVLDQISASTKSFTNGSPGRMHQNASSLLKQHATAKNGSRIDI